MGAFLSGGTRGGGGEKRLVDGFADELAVASAEAVDEPAPGAQQTASIKGLVFRANDSDDGERSGTPHSRKLDRRATALSKSDGIPNVLFLGRAGDEPGLVQVALDVTRDLLDRLRDGSDSSKFRF